MKKYLSTTLLIFTLIGLQGCVFSTQPLCGDANIEDLPGIEGTYVIKLYSFEDFELISHKLEIQRTSRGHYSFDGKGEAKTCKIGGVFYFEGHSEAGFNYYRIEPFSSESGERGFHLMLVGASKKELERKGIPYTIIEAPDSFKKYKFLNPESKQKALVIDNSKLSADESAQLLEPLSFSFSFIPTR